MDSPTRNAPANVRVSTCTSDGGVIVERSLNT